MVGSALSTHVRVFHHNLSALGIVVVSLAVAALILLVALLARHLVTRGRRGGG